MKQFDVIVIGTGTAGQTAAYDLAAEGYSVAIAESSRTPGGVCALSGCQAKKYFYEAAETVARSRHLLGKGITALAGADWRQIRDEKNRFTAKIPQNTVQNLKGNQVMFLSGQASFVDGSTIDVAGSHYSSKYFIIAVGAQPRTLSFAGAEYLATSTDFLDLDLLPKRIAFVGGGFVSFEFAHFAAQLGSSRGDIHILDRNVRPLRQFDKDIVEQLVRASEAEGINLHADAALSSVEKTQSGYVVTCESGLSLEVDLVVNGAGRVADIEPLHLDAAGVGTGKNGITVDPNMRSSSQHIFAVGDCAESIMLARVADQEAHVAAAAIVALEEGGELPTMDYRCVPAVLFTYPQLGMVGKTEEQLQQEKRPYWKSCATELNWPTYSRIGMKHAAYKILADEKGQILGAHFLADNTTGLVNTIRQAMLDRMPVTTLKENSVVTPYPSRESDIIYMLNPLSD